MVDVVNFWGASALGAAVAVLLVYIVFLLRR